MTDSKAFQTRYGPWALVTGAARGLGAEFARQLAEHGINLVLVDILKGELNDQVGSLTARYSVEIKSIVADLSQPDFIDTIRPITDELEIGLLVSNAALGQVGPFFDHDMERNLDVIYINCRAPLILIHEFGRRMVERRRGGIIVLSSSTAFQGTPLVANYAATKAYNLVLGESLWEELRDYGIDVLAFAPSSTNTPGFYSVNPNVANVPSITVMEPEPVIREALDALGKCPSRIPGKENRRAAFLMARILPRRRAIEMVGQSIRALYTWD